MTKAEKIHFRLLVSSYSKRAKANYLILYDEIDRQKVYDEAAIKNRLHEKFSDAYFAYEKNNLYIQICRALIIYGREKSVDAAISEQLQVATVLKDKSFTGESLKKLNKVKTITKKYELFSEYLSAFNVNRLLLGNNVSLKGHQQRMELCERSLNTISQLKEISKYNLQLYLLYYATLTIGTNVVSENKYLAKLIKKQWLISTQNLLSVTATILFYRCSYVASFLSGDIRKSTLRIKEYCQYLKKREYFFPEGPEAYFRAQGNLLMNMSYHETYENIYEQYKMTQREMNVSGHKLTGEFKTARNIFYISVLLNAIIHSKNYHRIQDLIIQIEELFADHYPRMSNVAKIQLAQGCSYCLFILGRYKESIEWTNKVINDKQLDYLHADFHFISRLVNILSHYELGNYELVEFASGSLQRFLKKKRGVSEIENTIFSFIDKFRNLPLPHEKEHFKEFRASIKQAENASKGEIRSHLKNEVLPLMHGWIDSKLNGKTVFDNLRMQ